MMIILIMIKHDELYIPDLNYIATKFTVYSIFVVILLHGSDPELGAHVITL